MFNIKLADICIGIDNKYLYLEKMCSNYITSDTEREFVVSVTDEEIMAEKTDIDFPPAYLESLAVYRKIAEKMADYDGLLMHGVVLEAENSGVALLAKSGVGKSTHARFWLEFLGNRAEIINGDKPIVRIKAGIPFAYGTPWAGKEGIEKNKGVPLKKICFIKRGNENSCVALEKNKVLTPLLNQIHFPDNKFLGRILGTVEKVVESAEFFEIHCINDISAAEAAYNEIFK
ncbi:MAG: hypothetical protein J6D15_01420 [Clostridia bacterium]|nr:hypothetical protein [Clostridia bacterium]